MLHIDHVRFGSQADICSAPTHVRFTPNSDRESRLPQTVMSALPPKADMCSAVANVCFGPIADIPTTTALLVLIRWVNGAACMIFPAELHSRQSFCIGDAGRQTPCHIVARLLFENHMWRGPAH